MTKAITYLKKELKEVENNFDYYDSSDSTKRLIESEKRQIERLIKTIKLLKTEDKLKTQL